MDVVKALEATGKQDGSPKYKIAPKIVASGEL